MIDRYGNGSPLAPSNGSPSSADYLPEAPAGRDVDLARAWKALLRRRKLFLGVFLGFVALVLLFSLVSPKTYTAEVKLIAGSANASGAPSSQSDTGTGLPILNALLAANGVQSSETYAELIQQAPVADEVSRSLHLGVGPSDLLSHVKVKPVPDTAILSIAVSWKDPQMAAQIANQIGAVFVDRERQLVAHQADSAVRFLQQQLPDAEQHMRVAQIALSAYQQQTGLADLPAQTQSLITSAAALDAKRQQVELDGRLAAASLQTVQAELAQTPATVVGTESIAANPVAAQLQTQISTLQGQLTAARQQYTENYPTVIALRAQLAQAQRQFAALPRQVLSGTSNVPNPLHQQLAQQAAQLQANVAAAQAQTQTLQQQAAQSKPALAALPEQSRRITDLQRQAKSTQNVYDALQSRYQNALISKTTAISDVTITQAADPANVAVKPNLKLNLLLGFVVGLALAVSAVLIAEFFDDRFRSEDDVKERLSLPVLATIPQLGALSGKDSEWVKPLSVEAFYQLVASLRYSSTTPPRTIAFTSPNQGDGKSTVAVNTAISLGLMKARVLVIDADLRRPTIHQKLNLANERGLTDVLVGIAALADVIKPTDHPGVSALTSGRSAPNPVGLLQSADFDRLLQQARERFDFVIVDGPALRSIVDGVILGVKTEGTVLVISAQQSEGRAVQAALAKLRGARAINLLGVVLNGTRPDTREQSNYYLGAGQTIALTENVRA